MKKAFTLLELMIAIAVLVTLMGLVFRINIAGANTKKRTETVMRMQKLENCISGYYAAFGSYPPVKLHQSRNIYLETNKHGIQQEEENKNIWGNEAEAWRQVKAACSAQPVGCRFPFASRRARKIFEVSEELKARVEADKYDSLSQDQKDKLLAGFDDGFTENEGRFDASKTEWGDIQIFRYGLMSYLLPRYLVMMGNDGIDYEAYAQWTDNNDMPCDALTGRKFNRWNNVQTSAYEDESLDPESRDYARVANIPSQAVCARWMPNLEKICTANYDVKLFGINIWDKQRPELRVDNPNIEIFSPNGRESDSTAGGYILDGITVTDGWGNEFYYYSPAPYQRYILWSAGDDGKTFPPWIDRTILEKESAEANKIVGKWVKDDIIHLSN